MSKFLKPSIVFTMIVMLIALVAPGTSTYAASYHKRNVERILASYDLMQKYFYQPSG